MRKHAILTIASLAILLTALPAEGQVVVNGSVFGGGKGSKTDHNMARVSGDATVTMEGGYVRHSVYGGGENASVGTYNYATAAEAATFNNTHQDEPAITLNEGDVYSSAGGGTTTVTISGGEVGPEGDMAMPTFTGHVFGGGQGATGDTTSNPEITFLAYTNKTFVTITEKAFIKGSVYGGSENGHVLGDTYVKIAGGQIGKAQGVDDRYNDDDWKRTSTDNYWLDECPHWDYDYASGSNTPYDKFRDDADFETLTGADFANLKDASTASPTDGHTFYGNVFGGGSGYFPYAAGKWVRRAGRVGGNTKVEITGGHILTSVYGGCELTDVVGACTVEMSGGTVGVPRTLEQKEQHPVTCNLYGAGKGDQRTHFNQWTNVKSTTVKVSGGEVYGSVFGGGEDGHVLDKATTTISGEAVIGNNTPLLTEGGASGVDGNVFGGGRGFSATALTAGVVCGNVDLKIEGGRILGSVFGGGRLAAVGSKLVPPNHALYGKLQQGDDHGFITVSVSGGTIGNLYAMSKYKNDLTLHKRSIGDVFGASKGTTSTNDKNTNQRLGLSKHTKVTVSGETTRIYGNVYGGGEIASVGDYSYATNLEDEEVKEFKKKNPSITLEQYDVYAINKDGEKATGTTTVIINGGVIGVDPARADLYTDAIPTGDMRTAGHTLYGKGHVFGGCLGQVAPDFTGYSFVNDATVTVSGTAYIIGSVFGGGENGHVFGNTIVGVSGGQVGMELADNLGTETKDLVVSNILDEETTYTVRQLKANEDDTELAQTNEHYEADGQGVEIFFGNVYGGGRGTDEVPNAIGDNRISENAGRVYGNTEVNISGTAHITHNVYGGGSLANVGTPGDVESGVATVNITGGTIGFDNGVTFSPKTGEYYYNDITYDPDNNKYMNTSTNAEATDAEAGTYREKVKDFYLKAGRNEGRVYGSGRGEANKGDSKMTHMAFVKYANVTIGGDAQVRGSVFGGGANGHVRRDTDVKILGGGQVGIPLVGAPIAATNELLAPSDTTERSDGVGPTIYRGNVYGGGRGISVYKEDGVSHYSSTAGRVYGNANITISGGRIWHHVYGGGSLASVGDTVKEIKDGKVYDLLDSVIDKEGNAADWVYHYKNYLFYRSQGQGDDPTAKDYELVERPYLKGDPITGTGSIKITMNGGILGRTGKNEGRIYGSGRGISSNVSEITHLAFAHNTDVLIEDGADIRGCVFGGGANGHVTQNSHVKMTGGTIGAPLTLEERKIDEGTGVAKHRIYRGNIYGGGRGVDPIQNSTMLSQTAGRVFGNTWVELTGGTVRHSIYGGGSLASVGTYDIVNQGTEENPDYKHQYIHGTGQTRIEISGGRVGPKTDDLIRHYQKPDAEGTADLIFYEEMITGDIPEDEASMTDEQKAWLKAEQALVENFRYLGDNEGFVYGSGRGVAYTNDADDNHRAYVEMAFVHHTFVTIENTKTTVPEIIGSVFGGGENGHVKYNTYVDITGGRIGGVPLSHHHSFAEHGQDYDIKVNDFWIPTGADADKTVLVGVADGRDELNEINGVGKVIYRGNVYGGGRGVDHKGTGASAAWSSTSGRIYGSTRVHIGGLAKIYRNVFGGGSMASVGTYDMDGDTPIKAQANLPGWKYNDKGDKVADNHTDSTGTSTVIIDGGYVGITGSNEGSVFGGGRGLAGEDGWKVTHLAYVNKANVTLNKDKEGEYAADVRGSVFGGGADGHVLTNTYVTVNDGEVGAPITLAERELQANGSGSPIYRGNVYGGGRGVDPSESGHLSNTAGRVFGNTYVNINGGIVRHAVYGGGSLASVGTYILESYNENEGKKDANGNDLPASYDVRHVYTRESGDTRVTISGGRIGPTAEDLEYRFNSKLKEKEHPIRTDDERFQGDTIRLNYTYLGQNEGMVYGSGRGVAYTTVEDQNSPYAELAFVRNSYVVVQNSTDGKGNVVKPIITGSVFGGGENGHVRFDTHVEVTGGQIGGLPVHSSGSFNTKDYGFNATVTFNEEDDELAETDGVGKVIYRGNVYGGGRGIDHSQEGEAAEYSSSAGRVYGCTNVTVGGDAEVYSNVYGGGSMASVGNYEYTTETVNINGIEQVRKVPSQVKDLSSAFYYTNATIKQETKRNAKNDGDTIVYSVVDSSPSSKVERTKEQGIGITNVIINGGQIGRTGYNEGRVYGGGRGVAGESTWLVTHLAFCDRANVAITKDDKEETQADVRGSVFGGGANGHVLHDTKVVMDAGYVGWGANAELAKTDAKYHTQMGITLADEIGLPFGENTAPTDYIYKAKADGTAETMYRGNVYGGGRGVDPVTGHTDKLSLTAGRVYGNTEVEIKGGHVLHNVYGGGSLASVGDTLACSEDYPCYDVNGLENTTSGNGQYKSGTGKATVTIGGNATIGWNGRDNNGQVYGSGRGMAAKPNTQYAYMAFVHETEVTVKDEAHVMGSVFGGGANGHVEDNTLVTIQGNCQVGTPLTDEEDRIDQRGNGITIFHGNVYGGGRGIDRYKDAEIEAFSTSAGRVYGNTNVNIEGGKIYHNVYGGGSLASVGTYRLNSETNMVEYTKDADDKDSTGKATITISGGQIGTSGNNGGHVFGSGRGMAGSQYAHMAFVRRTVVNIETPADIRGSVFGSGENGHVMENTEVNMTGGTVGRELTYSGTAAEDSTNQMYVSRYGTGAVIYRGNVYGGGRGVDPVGDGDISLTAGAVYGNTLVKISGGTVRHAVYGGGSLASVGTYDRSNTIFECANNTGTTAVYISGNAYIGNHTNASPNYRGPKTPGFDPTTEIGYHDRDGFNNGEVYGSGRGMAASSGNRMSQAAYVCNSEVYIQGGHVCGSVFGGGANGHVLSDTKVKMTGGIVGTPLSVSDTTVKVRPHDWHSVELPELIRLPNGEAYTDEHGIDARTIFRGNIYGGGRGVDNLDANGAERLSYTAGRVFGNTEVEITSGQVYHNVYGGGSLASVGRTYYRDAEGNLTSPTPVALSEADKATFKPNANDYRKLYFTYSPNKTSYDATGTRFYQDSEGKYSSTSPTGNDAEGQLFYRYYSSTTPTDEDLTGQTFYKDADLNYTLTTPAYYDATGVIDQSGICTVTIGGDATIGYAGKSTLGGVELNHGGFNNGRVFGSGRGMASDGYSTRAYARDAKVTIEGEALVMGSVFGSGENGHLQGTATVNIKGGSVGRDVSEEFKQIDEYIDALGVSNPDELKEHELAIYSYIGNVYGGGRGVDLAENGEVPFHSGYVRGNTVVNVTGGTIYRNVYGGGSLATVGDYGLEGEDDYWNYTGSSDPSASNFWERNANNGLATVNIHSNVGTLANQTVGYGGNVYGSARGRANDAINYPSLDFGAVAYCVGTLVNIDKATAESEVPTVYGSVYGGGENGHVDWGGTTVNITNGHVVGSVFGGGKGSKSSPTAGIVDGHTQVHIGKEGQTSNEVTIGEYVFAGNDAHSSPLGEMRVDVWRTATPGDQACPELKGISEEQKQDLEAIWTGDSHTKDPSNSKYYALKGVYGGSNEADVLTGDAATDAPDGNPDHVLDKKYITQRLNFDPTAEDLPESYKSFSEWPGGTSRKSVVVVHECDVNTAQYVYGGGRAADSRETNVTIEGGHVYRAFAGGDGSTTDALGNALAANISGDATLTIKGGLVHEAFGGSNTTGMVNGISKVELDPQGCELINESIYGGGNEAAGGDVEITIPCSDKVFGEVFGGARNANIGSPTNPKNVVLNIEGSTIGRVFGGNNQGGIIYGNVTLNIYGGTIGEAYGGNNAGGNITGNIVVNIDSINDDSHCPLQIDYVYGGGRDAHYVPDSTNYDNDAHRYTTATLVAERISPVVNLRQGTVRGAMFGGGYGTAASVKANPKVVVGGFDTIGLDGHSHKPARIGSTALTGELVGDVFGGGNMGQVDGSTLVVVAGDNTMVSSNVYGGGNNAQVGGNTEVSVGYDPAPTPTVSQAIDGTVTLGCAATGAKINYSVDGGETWIEYSAPFIPTEGTKVLRVRATSADGTYISPETYINL